MSGRLLLGLFGGLSAFLLLLIAWEILAPDVEEAAAPTPAAAHDQTTAAGRPAPAAMEVTRWVNTILARPLFSPTRKPDAAPSAAGPSVADDHQDLPRLSGIFSVSNARHAVFQPAGDVPPLVVGEGELVAGWNVVKIDVSSVTLKGPNGETTLEPKFDENLVPPSAPAPVYTKPATPAAPRPGTPNPGQPQPAVPPNMRGGPPATIPGQPPRTPGQPNTLPGRPPFTPQQRTVSPGGVQQQPGVR